MSIGLMSDACQIIKKKGRRCSYQKLRISNSGGTSLSRGVSSVGGNSRAFGEFIEDDKNQLHIHPPPVLSPADESSPRERKEGGVWSPDPWARNRNLEKK